MNVSRFLHRLDEDNLILLTESSEENNGMLQKVLQKVLQINIIEINENREQVLQRVLWKVLRKNKEMSPTPPKRNIYIKNLTTDNPLSTDNKLSSDNKLSYVRQESAHTSPEHENSPYKLFVTWISDNAPYCYGHMDMITEVEYYRLKDKYTSQQITEVISQLENRVDLRKKYSNLYRTTLNWLKREHGY